LFALIHKQRKWLAVLVAVIVGVALTWWRVPLEWENVDEHLRGFPDSDQGLHRLRPLVLTGLFFFPALLTFWYACLGMMDRWLVREFLQSMLICYGGILLIFFLIDFSAKASRLSEGGDTGMGALIYYTRLSPFIVTLLLPLGLLFSTMYCVSRISRSRELVATLQSGRSILRVMWPIYLCATFAALFHLGCSFHWAPVADGEKSANMDEIRGRTGKLMDNAVYYYAPGRRMWMIREIPRGFDRGQPMLGVEVTTLNQDGSLKSRLYAKSATWEESDRVWKFYDAELTDHYKNQAPIFVSLPDPHQLPGWRETPAQIVKKGFDARHMGMPDLSGMMLREPSEPWLQRDYSRYATQWHYRMALPVSCLLYVMIAIPFCFYVTRRPRGGAMAITMIVTILHVLISSVALALGEAGNMTPMLAAWLPVVLFAIFGVWMMRQRINA
jgi:lipopolysaccharide export system permease protein